jgi:protein-S-isoprenylcysteine O-methyltransferase Ste14
MRVIDLVILVGWIAFWLYWLAASTTAKAGRTSWGPFAGFRVALILLVLLLLRLKLLKTHAVNHDLSLGGIGLALFALGLGLAVWARVYLGQNWGMPMTQKDDPELVTTGPYHAVRHPIYSGMILAMIGTAIAVSVYWLIAAVVLGGYFIYSAVREERYMGERFPDSYPGYKQSTKMLVPFLL